MRDPEGPLKSFNSCSTPGPRDPPADKHIQTGRQDRGPNQSRTTERQEGQATHKEGSGGALTLSQVGKVVGQVRGGLRKSSNRALNSSRFEPQAAKKNRDSLASFTFRNRGGRVANSLGNIRNRGGRPLEPVPNTPSLAVYRLILTSSSSKFRMQSVSCRG